MFVSISKNIPYGFVEVIMYSNNKTVLANFLLQASRVYWYTFGRQSPTILVILIFLWKEQFSLCVSLYPLKNIFRGAWRSPIVPGLMSFLKTACNIFAWSINTIYASVLRHVLENFKSFKIELYLLWKIKQFFYVKYLG